MGKANLRGNRGRLIDMDARFFDSLFEGDSANGVKLGMGLTGGDFWPRVEGCQNLYRGGSVCTVDFDTILAVRDINEILIGCGDEVGHETGQSYLYVVRRANRCGDQEQSFGAAIRVVFDDEGDLIEPGCNKVFSIFAEQIEGPRVRVVWYYCPIGQETDCGGFNVYSNNGTGQIDYAMPVTAVDYAGARFYIHESGVLSEGKYLFVIRAVSKSGQEDDFDGAIEIEIGDMLPDGVGSLSAECV